MCDIHQIRAGFLTALGATADEAKSFMEDAISSPDLIGLLSKNPRPSRDEVGGLSERMASSFSGKISGHVAKIEEHIQKLFSDPESVACMLRNLAEFPEVKEYLARGEQPPQAVIAESLGYMLFPQQLMEYLTNRAMPSDDSIDRFEDEVRKKREDEDS